ncbi:MAG: PD-(D/E)XK nuclease family protein, partial [Bacteroidota bacterium]|nr:PD-(D/E)XK nuclease family protein [Bacteroidota bacterium]
MSTDERETAADTVWQLLARGGSVCTSTQRLSRELRRGYDAHMERSGHRAWAVPRIAPFGGWLAGLVERQLLFGEAPALQGDRLLTAAQEALTWEHAIQASGEGDSVLQTETLSATMMEAHAIEHAWLMDEEDIQRHRNEGSAAYLHVRDHVRRIWREKGLLPSSMLPRLAMDLLRAQPDLLPRQLLLAGFDLLPDAAMRSFRALYTRHRDGLPTYAPAHAPAAGPLLRYENFEAEVHAAAQWCRELLLRGESNCAVVVPSLEQVRSTVDNVFRDVLVPGVRVEDLEDRMPYELSLGSRCADEPVIAAAQWALELLRHSVPTDALSALLRSPYFHGADRHADLRARMELRLRRSGVDQLRHRDIVQLLGSDTGHDALLAAMAESRPAQQTRSAAAWTTEIDALLRALGWPGDLVLTSREYQALRRWKTLLEEFVSFDTVLAPMSGVEMLSRLRRMLGERIFQPETHQAPVQVMGMLETAGLGFRHARVLGLNEDRWPPPARIHPYHPLVLQRALRITEAVPERYLAQMHAVTRRIEGIARDTVFSCSANEADRELLPSPLMRNRPVSDAAVSLWTYGRVMQREYPATVEFRPAEQAASLGATERIHGGARVLTLQSACPFRAFAELRLHAEEPEIAESGLRPLDRGNLLHGALERLWEKLGTGEALRKLDPHELRERIAGAIDATERSQRTLRSEQYPPHVRAAERACLQEILGEWMDIERERPPFAVVAREEERAGRFGPLHLRLRIDRVDRLADGSQLLIDYKTGWHRPGEWMDARPSQPQLPMYAMTGDEEPGGIAFGVLQRGNCALSGIARDTRYVPMLEDAAAFLQTREDVPGEWTSMLAEWRATLTRLAEEFASGYAAVDP